MKEVNEMNVNELREHLRNLYDVENTITNNGNGWVHPATARHANLQFKENRKEMQMVSDQINKIIENSFEHTVYYVGGDNERYLLQKEYEEICVFGKFTHDCLHQDIEVDIFMEYDEETDVSLFHRHEIIEKM